MTQSELVRVPLDAIADGVVSTEPILGTDGAVLLEAGQPLTREIREELRTHLGDYLEVDACDAEVLQSASAQAPKDDSAKASQTICRVSREKEPYDQHREIEFRSQRTEIEGVMSTITEKLRHFSGKQADQLRTIPSKMLKMMIEDADQSLAIFTEGEAGDAFVRRAAQFAALTVNTAIELQIPENKIAHVGLAALLHDTGLLQLPDRLRFPTPDFAEFQRRKWQQHPLLTVESLANMHSLDDEVRELILQVHELPDGTGFPYGLTRQEINPLASILSIVDCYLSLTQPNAERAGICPHDAIAAMLLTGRNGRFDGATMRAFIRQLTLFAIGTRVELEDGRLATVLRRNEEHYHLPVVILDDGSDPTPVSLAEIGVSVKRPLPSDMGAQMRMPLSELANMQLADLICL